MEIPTKPQYLYNSVKSAKEMFQDLAIGSVAALAAAAIALTAIDHHDAQSPANPDTADTSPNWYLPLID